MFSSSAGKDASNPFIRQRPLVARDQSESSVPPAPWASDSASTPLFQRYCFPYKTWWFCTFIFKQPPYFSSITCYASCGLATRLLTLHLSPFTIILVSLYFTWYLHCSVFYLGSNMVQKRYFSIEFLTSFQVHSTTSNWSGSLRKPVCLGQLFCAWKCKQPTTRSPSQP